MLIICGGICKLFKVFWYKCISNSFKLWGLLVVVYIMYVVWMCVRLCYL